MSREIAARMVLQKLESLGRSGLSHLGKTPNLPPLGDIPAPKPAVQPMAQSQVPVREQPTTLKAPATVAAPMPRPAPAPVAPTSVPASRVSSPSAPPPASTSAASTSVATGPSIKTFPDLPDAERKSQLAVVQQEVAGCKKCELCQTRKKTVFGVGTQRPRLVFCGEAPGADEDAQGEPFVGAAGQLLTKIIQACGLQRSDVYILNVLKCRPPGNRTPLPDEVASCRGYLERQLQILKPEYLCALGATAAKTLLDTPLSIGRLRGKFQDYRGVSVLCTYHPSYLLRNPSAKKEVWEDMQLLMKTMGIEIKKAK